MSNPKVFANVNNEYMEIATHKENGSVKVTMTDLKKWSENQLQKMYEEKKEMLMEKYPDIKNLNLSMLEIPFESKKSKEVIENENFKAQVVYDKQGIRDFNYKDNLDMFKKVDDGKYIFKVSAIEIPKSIKINFDYVVPNEDESLK